MTSYLRVLAAIASAMALLLGRMVHCFLWESDALCTRAFNALVTASKAACHGTHLSAVVVKRLHTAATETRALYLYHVSIHRTYWEIYLFVQSSMLIFVICSWLVTRWLNEFLVVEGMLHTSYLLVVSWSASHWRAHTRTYWREIVVLCDKIEKHGAELWPWIRRVLFGSTPVRRPSPPPTPVMPPAEAIANLQPPASFRAFRQAIVWAHAH